MKRGADKLRREGEEGRISRDTDIDASVLKDKYT